MSKLTIVLPYYNVGDYIDRCLNSLLNQTVSDFEVFCVNDGSKDHSDEIVQKYVSMDSRFKRLVKQKDPHGKLIPSLADLERPYNYRDW